MRYSILLILACLTTNAGCTLVRQTDPPRTATELYLLSTAVENSIKPLSGEAIRGRLVYIDTSYVTDKDHQYLVASMRAKLLSEGARLAEKRDDAEVIVELRTPGVSIDRNEFLVGIPALPIGQLATTAGVPPSTITTPELAIIKNTKQWGTAGVAYVAYWRGTGEILASSGPHIGRSFREDWWIMGIKNTISNIPPARPPERDEAELMSQD